MRHFFHFFLVGPRTEGIAGLLMSMMWPAGVCRQGKEQTCTKARVKVGQKIWLHLRRKKKLDRSYVFLLKYI